MSKWTNGPWTMKRGEVCAWDEEEKSVIPLAAVYRSQAYCQGFAPESEDQHNAILMAAAPELYEALEKVFNAAKNGANLERFMDDEIDAMWANVESALKKARGEKA